MSHVVSPETGMLVHRLMRLVDTDDGLLVHLRWNDLPNLEDTLEPIANAYEDVPVLFIKPLQQKNASQALVTKARLALRLL